MARSSGFNEHRRRLSLRPLAVAAGMAIGLAAMLNGLGPAPVHASDRLTVAVTEVSGPITPVIRDHLAETVRDAATDGHQALVIVLDTPGGGLDVTRQIANTLLDAPLPTIVYVAPPGADAGSAGTFITYAAHIAAMAPATTIGAASPVDLEGGEVGDKIVENTVAFGQALAEFRDRDEQFIVEAIRQGTSVTSTIALERGAIDLVSPSLGQLLDDVDGSTVAVGETLTVVSTSGAAVQEYPMTGTRGLLQILANPNLAFIFLSLGTLAILYEIANPGLGLGGVAGVVMLILAMFSLAVLPVNYAGAALLLVAVAMFIAELFAPGIGVGAAGGTAALILGGLFLFQAQTGVGVDLWVLIPTAVVTFGLVVFAGVLVARTRGRESRAASDYLIGRTVSIDRVRDRQAYARVDGSLWRVHAADGSAPLAVGEDVRIVGRDNLELYVATLEAGGRSDTPAAGDDHTSQDDIAPKDNT